MENNGIKHEKIDQSHLRQLRDKMWIPISQWRGTVKAKKHIQLGKNKEINNLWRPQVKRIALTFKRHHVKKVIGHKSLHVQKETRKESVSFNRHSILSLYTSLGATIFEHAVQHQWLKQLQALKNIRHESL